MWDPVNDLYNFTPIQISLKEVIALRKWAAVLQNQDLPIYTMAEYLAYIKKRLNTRTTVYTGQPLFQ